MTYKDILELHGRVYIDKNNRETPIWMIFRGTNYAHCGNFLNTYQGYNQLHETVKNHLWDFVEMEERKQ